MHAKDTHTWLVSVNQSLTMLQCIAGIREEQLNQCGNDTNR